MPHIDLSPMFGNGDQEAFEKILGTPIHAHLHAAAMHAMGHGDHPGKPSKELHQHMLNIKMGNANSSMAFDNPRESTSEVNTAGFPPAPSKVKSQKVQRKPPIVPALKPVDRTVTPQHLEGDTWRSSPQGQGGVGNETGEDTGLP